MRAVAVVILPMLLVAVFAAACGDAPATVSDASPQVTGTSILTFGKYDKHRN